MELLHVDRPGNSGVLKIKCPFSVHGESVCAMLPLTLQKDTLHSTLTEMATLKRSITTYYYQVQGEMAVKG